MTTRCAGNDNLCFVDESNLSGNFRCLLASQSQLSSQEHPGRTRILQALLCRNRLCSWLALHTQDLDRDDDRRPDSLASGILVLQITTSNYRGLKREIYAIALCLSKASSNDCKLARPHAFENLKSPMTCHNQIPQTTHYSIKYT